MCGMNRRTFRTASGSEEKFSSDGMMLRGRQATAVITLYSSVLVLFYAILFCQSTIHVASAWQVISINNRLWNRQGVAYKFGANFKDCENGLILPTSRSQSNSKTTLFLANKLWDRLNIEEDEEPMWYLLNCVATNELDLLRQCRALFDDSLEDVVKFVVPLERKTRSHGANKMLTETKVKYPGYVFAKLRLCPHVYEAIQSLDLCRSWMGTVNHKGYKKLPPVPLALNEMEIENFGLEDIDENVDDSASPDATDAEGIILDSSEDEVDKIDEEYSDPMYRNVDKKALKQFLGLKVEDMIKVVKPGKFYNEDGIIRRLKEGKIFVRFYTYGTMFEEWLDPSDVRKLTAEEILRGLGGRSQPITQQDFDGPASPIENYRPRNMEMDRAVDLRGALGKTVVREQRNRRQDRVADRFKNNYDQKRDADNNWKWYKEQQQKEPSNQDSVVGSDNDWSIRAGSKRRDVNRAGWVESDVDSQWGRKSERQVRKENQKTATSFSNRRTEAAIEGKDDWSAFVSSASNDLKPEKSESDDFFSSLMSDLKKDLNPSSRDIPRSQQQSSGPKSTIPERNRDDVGAADDFFSSLLSDLTKDLETQGPNREAFSASSDKRSRFNPPPSAQSSDDDFFDSLLSDLKSTRSNEVSSSKSSIRPAKVNEHTMQQDDDFFASLEADLEASITSSKPSIGPSKSIDHAIQRYDDFDASLEADLEASISSSKPSISPSKSIDHVIQQDGDFDASLKTDLEASISSSKPSIRPSKSIDRAIRQDKDFFAALVSDLEAAIQSSTNSINANPNDVVLGRQGEFVSSDPIRQWKEKSTATQPSPATGVSLSRSDAISQTLSSSELNLKTVPALKDLLRERGLKVSGTKSELVQRLLSS